MQSAVLARGIPSVLHVPVLCPQNEDAIVLFSVSGGTLPLVSGEVNLIRILAVDHPQRERSSEASLYR